MFAAILRSLLRAVPEWMNQPAALLGRINRLLFEELSGVDMFITAQLVYLDSRARRITTASAGHCPVLLALDRDGNVKRSFAWYARRAIRNTSVGLQARDGEKIVRGPCDGDVLTLL